MYINNLLEDFHRLQNEMVGRFGLSYLSAEFPAVQIYSDKDHLLVRAEVPGLSTEEIDLSVSGNELTLSGKINPPVRDEQSRPLRKERTTGSFEKTIELPSVVDANKTEAVLKNGILTVALPVSEAAKPRQIAVNVQ